jgi:hypothetical protein
MEATRTGPVSDMAWRSPFENEYEITHSEPERWDRIQSALRKSADSHERGKTGEAVETERLTFAPDRMYRTDTEEKSLLTGYCQFR